MNLLSPRRFSSIALIPEKLTTATVALIVSVYFLLVFNYPVIRAIAEAHGLHRNMDYVFLATVVSFLMILINLLVSLPAFKYVFKPWLVILLIAGAVTSYYMQSYNVLINRDMIQNVVETDYKEASQLFSWKMLFYVILLGIIPAILVTQLPVSYHSLRREVTYKLVTCAVSFLGIALIAAVFYQDYASLFRNNRHIRDQVLPLNYLYASYAYADSVLAAPTGKINALGSDAKLKPSWTGQQRKVVSVIIVGETARAANFSLGGYTRDTNPNLKKQDIVYFNNFHSCGTATAVSVPCMFSNFGRKKFDGSEAKHNENLLDVIQRAGLSVLWRDNNSGCKGVCDRVNYDDVGHLANTNLCNSRECFDQVLLEQFKEKIEFYTPAGKQGIVVVLHQHGSHGPDYFQRVPPEFEVYKPICRTNQLQECTQAEIVNAYDNTIVYSDYVIANIITFLKTHQQEYDSSLLYLSDHGESLGENNLYLHGLPYAVAPDEQTHVPALFWMSAGFADRFQVDKSCLHQHAGDAYSHDNLFHSMLGLLDIDTSAYNPALDLFSACRHS